MTCTPVPPANLTDALGMATWTCVTAGTGVQVAITVKAPNGGESVQTLCRCLLSA